MALSLGFSSKKGSQSQQQTQDTTRKVTTDQTSQKQTATSGEQQQQVSTLDQQTQELLQNLIQASGGSAEGAQELVKVLQDRAKEAPAAFDVTPIVTEARRQGENQLTRLLTDLSQSAGSSQNSLVASLGAERSADLETQLAALQAQLGIQGRQAATQEITSAAGAGQNQLAQLVQLLKGAQTTGATSTTTTGTESAQATQNINELINVISNLTTKTKERGFSIGL